jgi:hypothetical protein
MYQRYGSPAAGVFGYLACDTLDLEQLFHNSINLVLVGMPAEEI